MCTKKEWYKLEKQHFAIPEKDCIKKCVVRDPKITSKWLYKFVTRDKKKKGVSMGVIDTRRKPVSLEHKIVDLKVKDVIRHGPRFGENNGSETPWVWRSGDQTWVRHEIPRINRRGEAVVQGGLRQHHWECSRPVAPISSMGHEWPMVREAVQPP